MSSTFSKPPTLLSLNEVRSTKERRPADWESATHPLPLGLNEVRSTKERRQSRQAPEARPPSSLNEVRSTKERRR